MINRMIFIANVAIIALLSLIACTDPFFKNVGTDNAISVNIVMPQSRGSIDVTDNQIIEVEVTVTGPDATQETQVWVPGAAATMLFENKGTGSMKPFQIGADTFLATANDSFR